MLMRMPPLRPVMMLRRISASPCFLVFILLLCSSSLSDAADFAHRNVTLTKLAFGSCHKRKYADASIWTTIAQQLPQAWLWTGDAVYPPLRGIASVEILEQEYQQLLQNKTLGYSQFHPTLVGGIYGTWDDHDYGGNDLGKEMPNKQERATAFLSFLGHAPLNQTRQGVYSSITWGEPPTQVKAILLDTRWHREDHCFPSFATSLPLGNALACVTRWLSAGLWPQLCRSSAILLGDEQWDWLEKELSDSQASIHILVSSIQVLTTNPVMESWGHFPAERDRLIRLLAKTPGVVMLSGDVHHAEILSPAAHLDAKNSFLEVTSSGLTHDCSKAFYGKLCRTFLEHFSKHRFEKDAYYIGKNFGTLDIDWKRQTLQVYVHEALSGQTVLATGPRSFQQRNWAEEELEGVVPCMDGHLIPIVLAAVSGGAMLILFLCALKKTM